MTLSPTHGANQDRILENKNKIGYFLQLQLFSLERLGKANFKINENENITEENGMEKFLKLNLAFH